MLTKTIKLLNYIELKGKTINSIAKQMKISNLVLMKKVQSESEFTADEIIEIANILEMKKAEMLDIFFDWK